MKTTAFKIFASCVAIVCLASSPVARAGPVLNSVLGTSENPIVEKQGIEDKNLVGLNVVDLKPHGSWLITNEVVQKPEMAMHEPMVIQELYRQLRSYDPELENHLRKELEGGKSSVSVDSKEASPVLPDSSNEVQDSEQSNDVQNSQSNESTVDSQLSDDVYKSGEHYNSNESFEGEGPNDSEENSDGSEPNNDDSKENDLIKPATPLLRDAK